MNSFHTWFKQEFNMVYQLADGSFNARALSLARYLEMAKSLSQHLTMHHTIEERYIFPELAKFMPKFGNTNEGEHLESHRGIHEGLENLDILIAKWKKDPSTYSPTEMRACLDGFREVLFHHLDEEVADLRGENLKKYMTLADVDAMPM
ncbi:hypothetical protein BDN70DRAFT_219290 [Pholiota conissans]|uniref:Hemerythrin-like domain-containing protein n=1 Tax=Pholiota conissans TaxID=109636 RepID=A0A9P5YUM6_9AGAR|nr:hypothetical protein BDN70DRAFT_219290 [Pholiota conissans]